MQYMLRTVAANGTSYGGFVWPLEVGAKVVAPDWNDEAKCGGGLHGLHNGIGDGNLLNWSDDAVWIVASVKKSEIVDLGGKVKVPRCKIEHVGNRESATRFLSDAGIVGPIVGGTATAGYRGTAMAGYRGTATAGDYGTATAGDYGAATAGYCGTATAEDRGTATAGYSGTATVGDEGTAMAGDEGTIVIQRWDDKRKRHRTIVGYIGENGLEPNTPYKLDDAGNFVKADV